MVCYNEQNWQLFCDYFYIILSIVNFQRLTFCDSLLSSFLNIFQFSISKNFQIQYLQYRRHLLLPCKHLQSLHCSWQWPLHHSNRSTSNYDRPILLHVGIHLLSRNFGLKFYFHHVQKFWLMPKLVLKMVPKRALNVHFETALNVGDEFLRQSCHQHDCSWNQY